MGSSLTKIVIGRDVTPPGTPSNLTATPVSASQINLACAVSVDPADEGRATSGVVTYRWWVSLTPTASAFVPLADTATPAYAYTGLNTATRYYFAVQAIDRTGNESELSEVVSAVTWSDSPTNRPPVWSVSSITLFAYPGDVVNRALTEASDPDGDPLSFSEVATGVLALIGLAVSSDGRVTGTIASDAAPQMVNATVRASDGQLFADVPLRVEVRERTAQPIDPDYLVRATMPGVFFATDWTERRIGAVGYPWADGSRTGQIHDANYWANNPVSSTGNRTFNLGPAYDNRGINWRELDPNIAGPVGGACFGLRRLYRIAAKSCDAAVVAPFSAMPLGYTGGTDSVPGRPGYRRGEKGTGGAGGEFKYVETDTGGGTGGSHNSGKLPCGRHFYIQFLVRMTMPILWHRERWIRSKHNLGQNPTLNNKLVFITGGQSTDQVAVTNIGTIGRLRPYLANGTSVRSWTLTRPNAGINDGYIASGTDNAASGEPAAAKTTFVNQMLRRYGPCTTQMTQPTQASWSIPVGDPTTPLRRDTHMLAVEAEALGLDPFEANLMSAPWRNYPAGGYDPATYTVFPGLNIPPESWGGMIQPDKWHVVEVLVSDQRDAPVDDAARTDAIKEPVSPRFVAMWAAPLGDAPQLHGYTNIGDNSGPGMIPARINDSNPILLKWQESDFDNITYSGWMVIGPSYHASAMAPTATEFDVILWNTIARRPNATPPGIADEAFYWSNNNRTTEWANVNGWGDNSTLGFCRGALASRDYAPPLPMPVNFDGGTTASSHREYQQAEILSTRLVPGAFATDPDGVLRPVHRVTLREALPLVPVAATGPTDVRDGFCANHINDRTAQDKRMYYGPVIVSCDPIPFPGHLDKPLPMPWRA